MDGAMLLFLALVAHKLLECNRILLAVQELMSLSGYLSLILLFASHNLQDLLNLLVLDWDLLLGPHSCLDYLLELLHRILRGSKRRSGFRLDSLQKRPQNLLCHFLGLCRLLGLRFHGSLIRSGHLVSLESLDKSESFGRWRCLWLGQPPLPE